MVKFTSTIKIRGVNPYVIVTAEQATKLKPNWKKPLPVLLSINNQLIEPWRTNMMPAGDGSFYLYLHGGMRKASMTKVGDSVTIDLRFDAEYHGGPLTEIPAWFSAALEKNASAKKNWEALPPSRKKEIVRYFSQLKSAQAKDNNLQRALSVLSGNHGNFMGRRWN